MVSKNSWRVENNNSHMLLPNTPKLQRLQVYRLVRRFEYIERDPQPEYRKGLFKTPIDECAGEVAHCAANLQRHLPSFPAVHSSLQDYHDLTVFQPGLPLSGVLNDHSEAIVILGTGSLSSSSLQPYGARAMVDACLFLPVVP
jgi:hypothetical protein